MLSMEKTFLTTAFTLGLLCASGMTTAALAQDANVQTQTEVEVEAQTNMQPTPAQLEEFAEAESSVRDLHAELKAEAQTIETEEEAQAFRVKINNETVAAIQDTGMSVEEYKQIAMALQGNPELKQKYIAKYH